MSGLKPDWQWPGDHEYMSLWHCRTPDLEARLDHRPINLSLCVCRDISSISEMRAEIQMRTGDSFWAKNRQDDNAVHLQCLNDYWGAAEHDLTVSCQPRPQQFAHFGSGSRGRFHWKGRWVFKVTILCIHYCPSLCNCPSKPVNRRALRAALHKLKIY